MEALLEVESTTLTKVEYEAATQQDKKLFSVVKKSNAAIQKARYSLSLQQQKALCYLLAELKETDTPKTIKSFDIKSYYAFMGVSCNNYEYMRNTLKSLADKSWWINESGTERLIRFFNTIEIEANSGKVYFSFHENMLPYLQHLQSEFTQYKLWYTMTMHSEYSLRLYELLKSVAKCGNWYYKIAELKKMFGCEHYKQFCHFRQRVIEPAVSEINQKTDISVSYKLHKDGRSYTGIEFFIDFKNSEELSNANNLIQTELEQKTT